MKRSLSTQEQIVGILKKHQAGLSTQDLYRRHRICDAISCKSRGNYGDMEVSDAKKLRALEDENRKLEKLLAEAMLGMPRRLKRCLKKNF